MSDLPVLKQRLHNIHAVHEITDAMQIIATIMIGQAQRFLMYREKIQAHYDRLFLSRELNNKQQRDGKDDEWLIAFFSEKGFCGNFNPQLLPFLNKHKNTANVIIVGHRGRAYAERLGIKNAHYCEGAKRCPTEDLPERPFQILKDHGFPTKVKVIFNKYSNMFLQVPQVMDFFPTREDEFSSVGTLVDVDEAALDQTIFENYVKARIYYFISQSFTGEVASKLLMMQNATDSAEKLKGEISREVFKVRQAKITQELSEVISAYKVLQTQSERR